MQSQIVTNRYIAILKILFCAKRKATDDKRLKLISWNYIEVKHNFTIQVGRLSNHNVQTRRVKAFKIRLFIVGDSFLNENGACTVPYAC